MRQARLQPSLRVISCQPDLWLFARGSKAVCCTQLICYPKPNPKRNPHRDRTPPHQDACGRRDRPEAQAGAMGAAGFSMKCDPLGFELCRCNRADPGSPSPPRKNNNKNTGKWGRGRLKGLGFEGPESEHLCVFLFFQ